MKKKGKLLLFVLLSAFLFVGFGMRKSVNLLNDQKLIDLDKAIENSFPGAEMPEDIIDDTEGKDSAENGTEHPGGTTERERVIEIRVRNRDVSYGSIRWTNMATLKDRIRQDSDATVSFHLVDDYAEAHVYRSIMSILAELERESGLHYMQD